MRFEQQQMISKVEVLLNGQQDRITHLEIKADIFEELATRNFSAEIEAHTTAMKGSFEALNDNNKQIEKASNTAERNLLKGQQEIKNRFELQLVLFKEIASRVNGVKAEIEKQSMRVEESAKSANVKEVLDQISRLKYEVRKVNAKILQKEEEEERKIKEKKDVPNLKPHPPPVKEEIKSPKDKEFNSEQWKSAVDPDALWTVFREDYVVECRVAHCKKLISLDSNLREDNACVTCPSCIFETPLGTPKQGFEWFLFSPCFHFHQVPLGERPKHCLFCHKGAKCIGPQNQLARIPKKK